MPNEPTPEMRALVTQAEDEIDLLMGALEAGGIDPDEWEDEFQQVLTRYHLGAYMVGQAAAEMSEEALIKVSEIIAEQLQFLRPFKIVVQTSDEFYPGWLERAQMYASACNRTFWEGKMKIWPLPAMPGQGTQCFSNCRCQWVEHIIDLENRDGDFYWDLDEFVEEGMHCQTCKQRNAEWYPVRVRDGELQI